MKHISLVMLVGLVSISSQVFCVNNPYQSQKIKNPSTHQRRQRYGNNSMLRNDRESRSALPPKICSLVPFAVLALTSIAHRETFNPDARLQ